MSPLKRKPVSKYKSASKFRGQLKTVAALNMKGLARGGFRL